MRLTISADALARRVISPERAERFKKVDPIGAIEKAQRHEVFIPRGHDYLELDITTLSPEASAELVINRLSRAHSMHA